jgi:enediyne biosynthesis protein E4
MRCASLVGAALLAAGCASPAAAPPHFSEVTEFSLGKHEHEPWAEIDAIGLGRGAGAAIADFNGDGRLDLLLAYEETQLLLNDGGLRFHTANQPALAGRPAMAAAAGDLDGDGDPDLVLAGPSGELSLLANQGGAFTDVTAASGLAPLAPWFADSILVADLDHDGRADIYLAVMGDPRDAEKPGFLPANLLYRGDGALHFAGDGAQYAGGPAAETWTSALFGLPGARGALALLDLDDTFTNPTDRVGQPGTFGDRLLLDGQDITRAAGLAGRRASMGAAVGDVDGDGALDLFTTDFGAAHLFHAEGPPSPPRFVDRAAERGLDLAVPGLPWVYWGARFADLDRDGDLDLLVQGGRVCPLDTECQAEKVEGTRLLANDRGRFAATATDRDFLHDGTPTLGRALLTGDLDGDGDEDLLVCPFTDRYRLFRNDTPPQPSLRLTLRGTVSGPDADGAVVRCGDNLRVQQTGGEVHGQSARALDFPAFPRCTPEIEWPSGLVESVAVPPSGSAIVTERRWIFVARTGQGLLAEIDLPSAASVELFAGTKPIPLTGDAAHGRHALLPDLDRSATLRVVVDGVPWPARYRIF